MMKSYLDKKEIVMGNLYKKIFEEYPKEEIIKNSLETLEKIKKEKREFEQAEKLLENILNKTETYNVMNTLYELEERSSWDDKLQQIMKDSNYNQHRKIALNICDMYGTGATTFFGYLDCTFKELYPQKQTKSFLAKGVCAIIASVMELLVSADIEEDFVEKNLKLLEERKVNKKDMVELVYELQKPYNDTLTIDDCEEHIDGVLRKRQTYHTIQICYTIDKGVENKEFGDQFQAIVGNDEGLYGVDEAVNTSISKTYGEIAITNFGYLDKVKPGIIGELDNHTEDGTCNTFMDDTVCAIVSAACARLAHNNGNTQSKPKK